MLSLLLTLLAVILSVGSADSTTDAAERLVTEITDANFDNYTASGGRWMVEIYAPWRARMCTWSAWTHDGMRMCRCSHCRQLEPQWNLMAKELATLGIRVRVGNLERHSRRLQQTS